jgi:hypothetical protein
MEERWELIVKPKKDDCFKDIITKEKVEKLMKNNDSFG